MPYKNKVAVVVESPTKAKTISSFLPKNYKVIASYGHMRDLPKGALGVDVENNFDPSYVIPRAKAKQVNKFKKDLDGFNLFYLATDPDREGEAIAYHIREILKKNNKKLNNKDFKRVVFHEITKEAIQDSFERPTMLNQKLLDAQTARRVLDRLVGYRLSPLLWEKIRKGLSAGRVQSVALRLIIEREREIQAFKPEEYWEIEIEFENKEKEIFRARLIKKGDLNKQNGKIDIKNKEEAEKIINDLEKASYCILKVEEKLVEKNAYPPFITSTLQQAAVNLFGFSAKRAMGAAQGLFEKGFITYMRTDSFNLSESAVSSIRSFISKNYGKEFLPDLMNKYKSRSKVAQEAHEAIRTTDINKTPEMAEANLERDELKIYDLIWRRTLACQMKPAIYKQTSCDIVSENVKESYLLRANGNQIVFAGWKKIYLENGENGESILPILKEKDSVYKREVIPMQKFTQAPPRYTEASLIKTLEKYDIGRPSTYASTISTIITRLYVEKEGRNLLPTEIGFLVNDFVVKYFHEIINYDFTAEMEENLDSIARGEKEWVPVIRDFYNPFNLIVGEVEEKAIKIEIESEKTDEVCEICGKKMIVKFGRFGKFLACSGFPDCKNTKPFNEKIDFKCPECGFDIVIKRTKKGRKFFGCSNYPNCKYATWKKPKNEESTEN